MLEYGINVGMSLSVSRQPTHVKDGILEENFELSTLLSTGSLAAMVAEVSIELLDANLPEGYFSVGKSFAIVHDSPVIEGKTVNLSIKVAEVNNNYVRLDFTGSDEEGVFCHGTHERIIVQKSRLFELAMERAGSQQQ